MSGLSARTYSCGGDGDLLRGGGDGSLGGCFDSLGKNFKMPAPASTAPSSLSSSNSTSDGTGDRDDKEERSDESSSAVMMGLFRGTRLCRGMWRSESQKEDVDCKFVDVH